MKNLLRFLYRYHSTILFLVLEIVAFILIANYNSFHRSKLFNIRHAVLGGLTVKFDNYSQYLSLIEENKALREENVRLYNLLPGSYFNPTTTYNPDTGATDRKFHFIGARVINNSTNKQYNFITLNKGKRHGIEPEMAVICDDGIVGVIKESTNNYSVVISLLNREFFPNAMIKRNRYFGYIEWPGSRYDKVILKEIPVHVEVFKGDTIVTSGHSSIFPEGIMIGTVEKTELSEGIFYDITVDLSTNFKNLTNVLVVKNLLREEQIQLEEKIEHD
ncbi:MAG: rod shape-determining protein MreC [Bacteroidales bacterium]|jgi:rod shape-determining protein MreC